MKFAATVLAGLCCGSCLAAPARADVSGQERAQAVARELVGTRAPAMVLKTIEGESIDLASLYGKKAVYLKFWATWCVPCRQQMPHFEHTYETAGPGLAVIAIDVGFNDSVAAIRELRQRIKLTMPIVFDDGTLGAAFHLRVTPTHVVIGRDGRISYVGHLADGALDAALAAARLPATTQHPAAGPRRDSAALAVGDRLPRQSLSTLDGGRIELLPTAGDGRPTALVFLASWCESYLATSRPQVSVQCREMRTAVDGLVSDQRVRWIGIASGLWTDADDLKAYRSTYKVAIPLSLDGGGRWFRAFRVNDVPTVIVADASGRIVRRIDPGGVASAAELKAAIENP